MILFSISLELNRRNSNSHEPKKPSQVDGNPADLVLDVHDVRKPKILSTNGNMLGAVQKIIFQSNGFSLYLITK